MDRTDFLDFDPPGALPLEGAAPAPARDPPPPPTSEPVDALGLMMDELEDTFVTEDAPIKPSPPTKRRNNVARNKVITD